MILLCGIPSEVPLALVRTELEKIGTPYVLFNQRRFASADIAFEVSGNRVAGTLRVGDDTLRLEEIRAVYTRLMDDQFLPELRNEPLGSSVRVQCRALHDTLMRWSEIAPILVVNRVAAMGSNFSKPYQAQLIQKHGFAVPETLVTNDPEVVREFHRKHQKIIYKSISGVRSIVQTFCDRDLERLERVRWCPTQFQTFVEGTHVRVHTVGEDVFATAITSDATDYRYAHEQGTYEPELRTVTLPDELAERCVDLARGLGLAFAGIDLKIAPEGEVFCFEVNPSPAFSYYEGHTGQPIARALACYLSEERA